jgi:hypothetical protein
MHTALQTTEWGFNLRVNRLRHGSLRSDVHVLPLVTVDVVGVDVWGSAVDDNRREWLGAMVVCALECGVCAHTYEFTIT